MAERKHKVVATMSNHELSKSGSGISLDIYSEDSKLGTLLIGQGSMKWTAVSKKYGKRIDWTTFAKKMADEEYTGWVSA